MGTGIIYAAIVVAWAAYLLPLVRHHREQPSATRSDGTTGPIRVLGKRTSGVRARMSKPTDPTGAVSDNPVEPESAAPVEVSRQRPRFDAAARRRRVLFLILATAIVIAVFAYVGMVPWWSLAVPGGLLVGFVVLARLSVRAARASRRRARNQPSRTSQSADTTVEPVSELPAGTRTTTAPGQTAGGRTAAKTTADPADPAAAWVAHSPVDAWDPLPVTLPTYVTKAAAPARRVRTIDLSGAAAFSAGRLPEADLLTRQPASVNQLSVDELSAEVVSADQPPASDAGTPRAATG